MTLSVRRLFLYGLVSVFLLLAFPQDRLLMTPAQRLASPYLYNLVEWELSHLPRKWWHRLWTALPFTGSGTDRDAVGDYLRLEEEVQRVQADVQQAAALPAGQRSTRLDDLQARLDDLRRRQAKLKPQVEEALEGAIGAVLAQAGIPLGLGPVKFPPVDFTFSAQPTILVTSLRDRVQRLPDSLLRSAIPVAQRDALETRVLRELNLSALVEDTGGVATYPAIISLTTDLRQALVIASHEWFHHFFYLRPLGQRYYTDPQMPTLNESAADLLGQEVGDRAYELLTGRKVTREPPPPPGQEPPEEPGVFSFQREMRETRLRVDELLALGKVEEAEQYMEERRQVFVERGHYIRKLNQAYFAFHGTYASSPASVSPIDAQLRELRRLVPDLGRFARLVSGVTSYDQFLALLEKERKQADATPPPATSSRLEHSGSGS